ncbi:beta-N-acetylglucosaminidase domain-containing protein [Streptomyces sp. HNM0574]|uniref:beta-N-acetylglucosaminidase domain-containing protein n=1 Tax=Streptomyces sp. HNM0574 TaxID=2714954 RepID=UPI003216AC6F
MGTASRGGVRRRAGATAVAAAFIGGLLSGAPAAQAAPPPAPDGAAANAPEEDTGTASGLPSVWPRPQSIRAQGAFVPVGREVTLVADADADEAALEVLRSALREAGARSVHDSTPDEAPTGAPGRGLVVRAGSESAAAALRALKAPAKGDLPAGGYRLAVGRAPDGERERDTVALEGTDGAGLFHAAQTLRQLITAREGSTGFAGATVRDWPTAAVRGVTEGFYGQSWSQRERLSQLDFLGRTKQNRYLYAPGDDPFRQATRWRDPYPAGQRAEFRALAERARANHVTLGWAVSPGQGLCFSSEDDRKALLRKVDSMRALGFTAFQLQFEDVSYSEWHCGDDADTYGSGPGAAARAHAELANEVARHLAERHPDAEPLSVMPTEYYQKGATEYRTALADKLDDGVEVAWTGVGVVPRTITGRELAGAREAFQQHPLVTMDNYPVNDWAQDRIFLGPYRGREPAVAAGSAGLLTNAMKQPTASRIPLFTAADYAWNPRGYRPDASWRAAIDDLAGGPAAEPRVREAVRALAGNDASSVLGGEESAYLRPLMDDFWSAYESHDRAGLRRAAGRLEDAYRTMREAGDHVPEELRREVQPWLEELALHGEAGQQAVAMLLAQSRGDGAAAWRAQHALRESRGAIAKGPATVGKGVLSAFTDKALKAADKWTGVPGGADGLTKKDGPGKEKRDAFGKGTTVDAAPRAREGSSAADAVDGDPSTAYRSATAPATGWFTSGRARPGIAPAAPGRDPSAPGSLTVRLPEPRRLSAVSVLTEPGSGTRADIEAHVPGEGWRRLGALSGSGWTQAGADTRADALRLSWTKGSAAPVVNEITPWYADTPEASLALSEKEVYVPIGGEPAELSAELGAQRPGNVRDRIRASAPEGFTVHTPERTTVPRGGTASSPVRIAAGKSAEPGEHRVTLSFGGEKRTVTVHAYPKPDGPDLAREARATSSADETADFPARAVNDGRRDTRWSSPAKDGEWVQLELAKPARVGEVVLWWQDAHAERYRVQFSSDGKRWRTAATVRDSGGGRESVRVPSGEKTRYIRVQGDERATEFGYSLWAVEAYGPRKASRNAHGSAGKHTGRPADHAGKGRGAPEDARARERHGTEQPGNSGAGHGAGGG